MNRLWILILLVCGSAWGTVWIVDPPTEQNVQNSILNNALDGDTVFQTNSTPGTIITNHWTWQLTNNPAHPNIILSGSGPIVGCETDTSISPATFDTNSSPWGPYRPTNYVNSTAVVVVDDTDNTKSLINFAFQTNLMENGISGFTILKGTNSIGNTAIPSVKVTGSSLLTRINNVQWWLVGRTDFEWDGWVVGSFDHNVMFQNGNYFGVQGNEGSWGGGQNGNGSWSDSAYFGTTNFPIIESCTITNIQDGSFALLGSACIFDGSSGAGGARIVVRYCSLTNCYVSGHGTESSQQNRGTVDGEVYGNTFYYITNHATTGAFPVQVRSGTWVIHDNWVFGFDSLGQLNAYRATPGAFPPWGGCDGTNAWDLTASNILATGSATTGSSSQLIDSGASWTVNQWQGGYMLVNTTKGQHAEITANTATTINYNNNTPVSGSLSFSLGDRYQIAGLVTAVLDQPGRNHSDVITNDIGGHPFNSTKGGVVAWPSETLSPVYEWHNRYIYASGIGDPNRPFLVGDVTVQTNRDYIDGVAMPGYSPLIFPNPLVGTNPPSPPIGQIARVTNLRVGITKVGP